MARSVYPVKGASPSRHGVEGKESQMKNSVASDNIEALNHDMARKNLGGHCRGDGGGDVAGAGEFPGRCPAPLEYRNIGFFAVNETR